MELGLAGRSAIVTGASSGIGAAIALTLAGEGMAVAASARREDKLAGLAERSAPLSGSVTPFPGDISADGFARDLVQGAEELGQLSVLVNNVGVADADHGWDISDEAWTRTLDINVLSAVRLSREAIPVLRRHGRSSIINVTSISAHSGREYMTDYNASKAALTMWSKTISREVAPEIRVNCVAPGFIHTPMWDELARGIGSKNDRTAEEIYETTAFNDIPMRRFGEPEEVAHFIAFLVSDRAAFITGTSLNIDGGFTKFAF